MVLHLRSPRGGPGADDAWPTVTLVAHLHEEPHDRALHRGAQAIVPLPAVEADWPGMEAGFERGEHAMACAAGAAAAFVEAARAALENSALAVDLDRDRSARG